MLIARRNLMGGKALPYLRRVAFLRSTGTQYINVPINASWQLSVDIVFSNSGEPTNSGVTTLGALKLSPRMRHHTVYSGGMLAYYFHAGEHYVNLRKSISDDNKIRLVVDASAKKISAEDDEGKTTVSNDQGADWDTGIKYRLFGRSGGVYLSKTKIYCATLFDNLKRLELIAVLDLSGRPCMYDKVSGQFFYNQGTGEFTWGELETASNAQSQLEWGGG